MTDLVKAVADRCRRLDGWPDLVAPPGYQESLALCVVDSIWSIGITYATTSNVVDRYRTWVTSEGRGSADERTASELTDDISFIGGGGAFADVVRNHNLTSSRGGVLKADVVRDAAAVLVRLGVETTDDLRARAGDEEVEVAWRSLHGQGSGTSWYYLQILAGVENVKPDRMICRFVADAGGVESIIPADAYAALCGAYELLRGAQPRLTLRGLDHAAWNAGRSLK